MGSFSIPIPNRDQDAKTQDGILGGQSQGNGCQGNGARK